MRRRILLATVVAVLALTGSASAASAATSDPGGGGGYNVPPSWYCTAGWSGWIFNWAGWDFRCIYSSGVGTFCYSTCPVGYFPTHSGWHRH